VHPAVKKRAAIYARSSAGNRTTATQIDTSRRNAEQLGVDVVHEFVDENVSAAVPLISRAGGPQLIAALGDLDALLVYRVDRLARSAL
jgi:DNA invertase Pin-like site-specific DNA recombinase